MIELLINGILNNEVKAKRLLDRSFFDKIYDLNVSSGDWKERGDAERDEIFSNYYSFEINGTFVGGVGLTSAFYNGREAIYLQCLHVDKKGNGIGTSIVDFVKSVGYPIITYSKKGVFFEKCGFIEILGEASSTGAKKYFYEKISL